MASQSVFLTLGLVTSLLALASCVLAISSSLWAVIRFKVPFLENDIGLMRHCDVGDGNYCGDMERLNVLVNDHYEAWFRSVQAMYLLHCVGLLISLVVYILYAVRFFETKGSFKMVTAFNFITVAVGVYAVAMFGTSYLKFFGLDSHYSDDPIVTAQNSAELGRAFWFAVVGCCFSFLVMVFSAMEASHAADILRNMHHRITVWSTPYTLFVDQETA